jgi:hypothetical protein
MIGPKLYERAGLKFIVSFTKLIGIDCAPKTRDMPGAHLAIERSLDAIALHRRDACQLTAKLLDLLLGEGYFVVSE